MAQEEGKERGKEGGAVPVVEGMVRVSFGKGEEEEEEEEKGVKGPREEEKEGREEVVVGGKVLKMAVTHLNRDLFRDLMEHVYM